MSIFRFSFLVSICLILLSCESKVVPEEHADIGLEYSSMEDQVEFKNESNKALTSLIKSLKRINRYIIHISSILSQAEKSNDEYSSSLEILVNLIEDLSEQPIEEDEESLFLEQRIRIDGDDCGYGSLIFRKMSETQTENSFVIEFDSCITKTPIKLIQISNPSDKIFSYELERNALTKLFQNLVSKEILLGPDCKISSKRSLFDKLICENIEVLGEKSKFFIKNFSYEPTKNESFLIDVQGSLPNENEYQIILNKNLHLSSIKKNGKEIKIQ